MTESGKSLSSSKKYYSVLEKISKINDVKQNEKHQFRFNIKIWKRKCWNLLEMGKFEYNMADFENHRQFSLRCLSKGIIPTSVKLKTSIKTLKAKYIIRKAEISLLNERIRSINNSIAMFKIVIDTCRNQLESIIDEATMEECHIYIERRREQRHQKTKERHPSKFYRLCQGQIDGHSKPRHGNHGIHTCINANNTSTDTCATHYNETTMSPNQESQITSNNNNINNNHSQGCWVRNFSKTPLTKAKQSLPSH